MSDRRDKWISLLAGLGLLAFLAVFALLNFRYLTVFCDGDVYADLELAREIWRRKTLFPSNWIFGNQYYVIATPILAALFYGLTGSLNLSLALATTAMGLLLLLSLDWMLSPFVPRRSHRLCALLFFTAAPMGTRLLLEPEGQLFFVLASYYACYLITLFFVFGDYVRALDAPEALRPGALVLSLALSFACGMQSLRQTAVMVLPLLALEALALLSRRFKGGAVLPKTRRNAACRALGYTAANLLGYGLMRLLAIPSRAIYAAAPAGLSERLHALWAALRGISGLDAALFGETPLFLGGFFAFQLLCVLIAALLLLTRLKTGLGGLERLWLLCLISLGGTFLAGLTLSLQMREIYLFVWYPLAALSLVLLLESGLPLRRLAALLVCLLSVGNLAVSYGSSLRYARSQDCAAQQAFSRDAVEAGVQYVYGDWSFLPRNAVWSDGALTVGFWDDTPFCIRESINLQDIYGEEENGTALYLAGPWDKWYFLDLAEKAGAELTLFGDYGDCSAYRADRQLMHFRSAGD